jgi:hypothetical protein
VLTAAGWRGKGIGRGRLRSLIESGDLAQVRHGVYATRAAMKLAERGPSQAHALQVAAVRAATGFPVIASHHSAARLHGLDLLFPPDENLVTVTRQKPAHSAIRTSSGLVVRTAVVPAGQLVQVYGIRATTVARTVIDVARVSSFQSGVAVADCALRLGKTPKEDLEAVAGSCAGWPGIERARRVIGFSDARAESVLESGSRVAFAEAGLEPPELQVWIEVKGDRYRVDFLWRKYRTIAESDGLGKYATPEDIRKQFERDRRLRAAGYHVVHFTFHEIFGDPGYVLGQIRDCYAAASGKSFALRRAGGDNA